MISNDTSMQKVNGLSAYKSAQPIPSCVSNQEDSRMYAILAPSPAQPSGRIYTVQVTDM